MITAQFILFFFAFLIICMFVMGALNRDFVYAFFHFRIKMNYCRR